MVESVLSQSLKDQGKSRTRRYPRRLRFLGSQSLKDQGKSRTVWKSLRLKPFAVSQSLKDQGKSRTNLNLKCIKHIVAIP